MSFSIQCLREQSPTSVALSLSKKNLRIYVHDDVGLDKEERVNLTLILRGQIDPATSGIPRPRRYVDEVSSGIQAVKLAPNLKRR